jgi:uncharacterized membrane protein YciS (DUF1049 family)
MKNKLQQLRTESRYWEKLATKCSILMPCALAITALANVAFAFSYSIGQTTFVPVLISIMGLLSAILAEIVTQGYWIKFANAEYRYRQQIKQKLEE